MDILVVGTGYVGLVTGTCMAEMGHKVICIDINKRKIDDLKQGKVPIFEPGLEEMLKRNQAAKRLHFSTDYEEALARSFVCFITVDTPISAEGTANLSQLDGALATIAEKMVEKKIIVLKSTVPVGTAEHAKRIISNILEKRRVEIPFEVISNPEFLKEGNAINDCLKPDRVVIGVESEEALEIMREIYAPFMISRERLIIMDIKSAEITKYAANMMLALRISFMNELSEYCEKMDANIDKVRLGIGSDHRIGYHFLYAGVGFGGSCLPKDIKAFKAHAEHNEIPVDIVSAIDAANERQKRKMFKKIKDYFSDLGGVKGKTFAIMGLSFKPDTDDMREAPSLNLIDDLKKSGAFCRLFDPVASVKAKEIIEPSPLIYFAESEEDAAKGADAIVLITEWKQFRFLDFEKIIPSMKGRAFFDGRNQQNPEKITQLGMDYISIGKKNYFSNQPLMGISHK